MHSLAADIATHHNTTTTKNRKSLSDGHAKRSTKALICGNWKCNGTIASVKTMIDILNAAGSFSADVEVVLAMPSLHLQSAKSTLRPDIVVAAEDVSFERGFGSFTGELSAEMLADSGITWALAGSSERRIGFGSPGESPTVRSRIMLTHALSCIRFTCRVPYDMDMITHIL